MTKTNIIVANWKMNGNTKSALDLTKDYLKNFGYNSDVQLIICPSYPYLSLISNMVKNSNIKVGAQNISQYMQGSYTGEVNGAMLHDVGSSYVIIGHSERRKYFHETNEIIADKINIAINHTLIPILCVGEELVDRKNNIHLQVIQKQISLSNISLVKDAIIAYEPVWSIGTGIIPSIEEIQEVINYIKNIVRFPVLYGGSVNSNNAQQIASIKHIDGLLVGNASLNVDEFYKIHSAASNAYLAS